MRVGAVVRLSLEAFFAELGCKEEVYGEAVSQAIAWQLHQAMQANALATTEVAHRMGTSRTQVERMLDPDTVALSLETLDRAARAVGKRLKIERIDDPQAAPAEPGTARNLAPPAPQRRSFLLSYITRP